MTNYVIVDPRARSIAAIACETLREAEIAAGLDPDAVDHGTLGLKGRFRHGRLGYAVHAYGLFAPPEGQSYFGMAGRLIAGPAVFHSYDETGETKDLYRSEFPDVRFYLGIDDVEAAIERGEIVRPKFVVNGLTTWQWPQTAPSGSGA